MLQRIVLTDKNHCFFRPDPLAYPTKYIKRNTMYKWLCYGLLLLLLGNCQPAPETTRPQIQPLTEAVYAAANVEVRHSYRPSLTVSGVIREVFVEEGDTVHIGQPLLRVESENPQLNVENIRLERQQTRSRYDAQIADWQNRLQTQQQKMEVDSLNYFRQKRLWEQEIGSAQTLEQYRLTYQASRLQVQNLRQQLRQTRQQAQQALQQLDNQLRQNEIQYRDFTLYSTLDGQVYKVYKEAGELAFPQEPLAYIGSTDDFILTMQVDEVDIAKVQPGQKVLITLDTYGETVFEGSVRKLFPLMDQRSQTFEVEADFTRPPERLFPGLTAEANIVTTEKEGVLVIPKPFLWQQQFVITQNGDTLEVEKGIANLESVEILSGIDTSTVLIKP